MDPKENFYCPLPKVKGIIKQIGPIEIVCVDHGTFEKRDVGSREWKKIEIAHYFKAGYHPGAAVKREKIGKSQALNMLYYDSSYRRDSQVNRENREQLRIALDEDYKLLLTFLNSIKDKTTEVMDKITYDKPLTVTEDIWELRNLYQAFSGELYIKAKTIAYYTEKEKRKQLKK